MLQMHFSLRKTTGIIGNLYLLNVKNRQTTFYMATESHERHRLKKKESDLTHFYDKCLYTNRKTENDKKK